jgi:hypothetical protein
MGDLGFYSGVTKRYGSTIRVSILLLSAIPSLQISPLTASSNISLFLSTVPFFPSYLLLVFPLSIFSPSQQISHPLPLLSLLKVPKCENFHRTDFFDFFTIKPLWVGDFRAKIKNLKF